MVARRKLIRDRLRALRDSDGVRREIDEELRFHLDMRAEENVRRGMSPEEARRDAERRFGRLAGIREQGYEVRGGGFVETLWQDLRYGARSLRKNPGFTLVAVLTLALGIGATTTMYSVLYDVMLNPFPYADAGRIEDILIRDLENPRGGERGALTVPEFLDYQEQSQVFEEVIGSIQESTFLATEEGIENFRVAWVTTNAFRFLGVAPLLGRTIDPVDGQPDAPPVAVLSHKAWVNRFGGDANVLGRTIVLGGNAYTVVGVMPPRFAWHLGDAWLPSPLDRTGPKAATTTRWFQGRLKPGVTREQAAAKLNVIANQLAPNYPELYPKRFTIILKTPVDFVVGRFGGVLYTLMGAVGVLLLIACCNVANLLLARATSREKEMAIRAALGAGRWRIFQQLLTESVLLAIAGAATGCLLAYAGVKALLLALPPGTIPAESEVALNFPVLLFSLATAGLTVLLFGLAPALHFVRRDVARGLGGAGKGAEASSTGGGAGGRGRLRNALVVTEVALSLVLLFGGALLMRGFLALTGVELGFRADNVLLTRLSFPPGPDQTGAKKQALLRQASERIAALPGVVSVAVANSPPPFGGLTSEVEVPGGGSAQTDQSRGAAGAAALVRLCDGAYVRTLGLRLLRGRSFDETEMAGARRVAIINETLERRHFGADDSLGKQIRLSTLATLPAPVADPVFEVVGVFADAKNQGVQEPVRPEALLPSTVTNMVGGDYTIMAQTSIDPALLVEVVRKEVRASGGGAATAATTLAEVLRTYVYAQPRFSLILMSVFAGLSLLMVAVGVYGVMSYAVARRTHEIGICLALGASARDVVWLVLRQGLKLVLVGVALGMVLTLFCARLIASYLYGVEQTDPAAIAFSALLLILVALLACYLPARRATKVDPLIALRSE